MQSPAAAAADSILLNWQSPAAIIFLFRLRIALCFHLE
jgi:hypothetical protein